MTRRSQVIGSLSTQTHKLIITYLQVNLPSQIKSVYDKFTPPTIRGRLLWHLVRTTGATC